MSGKIDHSFLNKMEGGSKINGYVPAARISKSGVTIGTGFDLRQRNELDLKKIGAVQQTDRSVETARHAEMKK
jgi:hypothetical protein